VAIKLENRRPEIRYLNDMREVLCDKEWAKNAPNFKLYYMYRGVKRKRELRYDITVIPPRILRKEFVKTKGHEHSNKYQELYIVLKGEAIYLIQKYKNNKIEDVYAVRAKRGNAVIIPPDYGHVTINPRGTELKEGNWLDEGCQNIYDLFIKKQGGCYYFTKSGWIKNKNYDIIPPLRIKKPLKLTPKNLDFLYGKNY